MTDSDAGHESGVGRVPPLNLTSDEADVLWEMLKDEIGREKWQSGDDRQEAESIHTKVKELVD